MKPACLVKRNWTSTAGRQVVMCIFGHSFLQLSHRRKGVGGLSLSKIKSHLMLEQLVPRAKSYPHFKNRQIHFKDLLFSLVAA